MELKEKIIEQIKDALESQSQAGASLNTEKLLLAGNKLSTLRFNLSDLWVEARYAYQLEDGAYKAVFDSMFLGERRNGATIEECKAKARNSPAVKRSLSDVIQKEKEMNQLRCLREDVAIKISNIQSFVKELSGQKYSGGL